MENDLNSVVDSLPGLVWTAQPDGQVDFFNLHWRAYTGLDVDEAYGSGWQLAIHPADRPEPARPLAIHPGGRRAGQMEARLRRFDGEYRWFFFRRPAVGASGQIVNWCGTGTELKTSAVAMSQHPREDAPFHRGQSFLP